MSGVNRTILSDVTARRGKDAQKEYMREVTGDATREASEDNRTLEQKRSAGR